MRWSQHSRILLKYLKKEYKNINDETLTLSPMGPCDIHLQNMSKIRTWVQCQKSYKIGNMKDVIPVGEPSEDRLEDNFKKFLDQYSKKKPQNVTRKMINGLQTNKRQNSKEIVKSDKNPFILLIPIVRFHTQARV